MNTNKKIYYFNNAKDKKKEETKTLPSNLKIVDNNFDKMEVEKLKKAIAEKLKDPAMAKKAAMIIAEMINKNQK